MTRLIIVRHAESHLNLQNRIQGQIDSRLTPKGLKQAAKLAARMKNFKIDKIYSSDLGRAYSTTVEITRRLKAGGSKKAVIIRDPLLREIHLGDWEGMTPEDVDKLYDKGYQKWLCKPSGCRIPKSETLAHFRRRVVGRLNKIAAANHGKTVLVVTHGGAITALLSEWLKADFDTLLINLHIENTSLAFVEYHGNRVRVRGFNDTTHLPRSQRNDHHVS